MWDLPGPGIQLVSTLQGGFLTTAPPGNPLSLDPDGNSGDILLFYMKCLLFSFVDGSVRGSFLQS